MMKNLFQTFSKGNIGKKFLTPQKKSRLILNNLSINENGIKDFYIQELKKAKYQGFFGPENYVNKNDYAENNLLNNNCQNDTKNKKHTYKSADIQKKISLTENEGKTLFIIESESKYPLITYRRRINKRNINNLYDYFDHKLENSERNSVKTNFSNRGVVDLKMYQKILSLKDRNVINFQKNNKILNSEINSNILNDINTSIDFNDNFLTFGKSIDSSSPEKEYRVNNDIKLINGYKIKLFQLFIERMKNFLKKNILLQFYKTLKEYIRIKEKNILNDKKNKFKEKEIVNNNTNICFTIYNFHEKSKTKDFNKNIDNSNILFKKRLIFRNESNQKKYDLDNFNSITINKNENKVINTFRNSKRNNFTLHTNDYSTRRNYGINLTDRINLNTINNPTFQNYSPIKNKLSNFVITKKSPKYKFLYNKKQSYDSKNYGMKNNNLVINSPKNVFKKKLNISNSINIKPRETFNYISSDNKIHITIKYIIYIPKIKFKKCIEQKINSFNKNLLEITKNGNFYYLFVKKENNKNNYYCNPKTFYESLKNIINMKNIDNKYNSDKINKGVLLLQNLIVKNYEEMCNNSESSIESEFIKNYSAKEENIKNNINNSIKDEQTEAKNNINSKLRKIITSIENKKNKNFLKYYFNYFYSLLKNKIKKQLIVQKTDKIFKVQKILSNIANKNTNVIVDDDSPVISDNSKYNNQSKFISHFKIDDIKIPENFNKNIKKTDISNSNDTKELIKNEDEIINELYHKYQDFILSFRLLLIFYSLDKINSCLD